MTPSTVELIGTALFAVALIHTFSTRFFESQARRQPGHAGLWHLLGEVEVVFGFWAMILVIAMFTSQGREEATRYIDTRNFTEPAFVFVVMVVAATRPILHTALTAVRIIARALPLKGSIGFYFTALTVGPLLGSLITEPAAMTLSALILSSAIFSRKLSSRLKYATLGVLFVNISIGGTLTPFAAPPVLMVAGQWGWDTSFMLANFGWKAALAVAINAAGASLLFHRELGRLSAPENAHTGKAVPIPLTLIHLGFLAAIVAFSHHIALFMGVFLLFLGVASAYQRHQDRLILREGLLVAFFLAGLVVLGGVQQWWLKPLLLTMSSDAVFFVATALTAVTDNAALTYLGSLVSNLPNDFKYALVAGAVTGGGLTVIANAPNPAGVAILREHFDDKAIQLQGLFLAALPPTVIAATCFMLL